MNDKDANERHTWLWENCWFTTTISKLSDYLKSRQSSSSPSWWDWPAHCRRGWPRIAALVWSWSACSPASAPPRRCSPGWGWWWPWRWGGWWWFWPPSGCHCGFYCRGKCSSTVEMPGPRPGHVRPRWDCKSFQFKLPAQKQTCGRWPPSPPRHAPSPGRVFHPDFVLNDCSFEWCLILC